jgi:hypothetical protein
MPPDLIGLMDFRGPVDFPELVDTLRLGKSPELRGLLGACGSLRIIGLSGVVGLLVLACFLCDILGLEGFVELLDFFGVVFFKEPAEFLELFD